MMPSQENIADTLRRRLQNEQRAAADHLSGPVTPFILASASPRRRELLQGLHLHFEIVPADIAEIPLAHEAPREFAARAAGEKAAHVAALYRGRRILAADTVVIARGRILGKPRDRADAFDMLEALSATGHRVCTAIALADEHRTDAFIVETEVSFRPLTRDEIEAYIDTGDPFDKAGAYGIQGDAVRFVTAVTGSYSNVIGLPLEEVAIALSAAPLS
jgi:septum formation protein